MDLVERIVKFGDRQARRALRPFAGTRNADLALPTLRREVKRLISEHNTLLSRDLRRRMVDFGAQYGLLVRSSEPMTRRLNLRFTGSQLKDLERAAKLSGVREVSEFVRNAAVVKAREVLGHTDDSEGVG